MRPPAFWSNPPQSPGLAAHLPGVLASLTAKPVIGIPLDGGALGGADALYAVVQMPPGVPVATVAIGSAGAKNAGHLAARILALSDDDVAAKVAAATQYMCHTSAKPMKVASSAMTTPAAVLLGMWMATKPFTGRSAPRCFMSCQASISWAMGVKAKL